MNKREIASRLEVSQEIGSGLYTYYILVEHSILFRYKYKLKGNTKTEAMQSFEKFIGFSFKLYGQGDGIWSLTTKGVEVPETYTLIK